MILYKYKFDYIKILELYKYINNLIFNKLKLVLF